MEGVLAMLCRTACCGINIGPESPPGCWRGWTLLLLLLPLRLPLLLLLLLLMPSILGHFGSSFGGIFQVRPLMLRPWCTP